MNLFKILQKTAAVFPSNTAAIYYEQKITYQELYNKVLDVSKFLEQLHLPAQTRIGIFFENSIDYMIAYFAITKSGHIIVPLDTSLSAEKLHTILLDSCIETLFVHFKYQRLFKKLYELPHCVKQIISEKEFILKDEKITYHSFDDIPTTTVYNDLEAEPLLSWDDVNMSKHELSAMFYTSGSTGEAKGVMLSHKNLLSNTLGTIEYLKLSEKDSLIVILPFYYIYGNSLLLTHIAVGATLVIDNRFMYAETILDTMESEHVTGISGVPSNFLILLNKSTFTERKFPHLRYITQAGGAMAPDITKRIIQAFPEKELYIMYGQTEASPRVTWLPPEKLHEKLGSIGIEVNSVTVELLDEKGNEVKQGEVGEIVVSGDSVMLGYWNQPEEEKSVLKNRKLFTGDLAKRDSDGYLFIVGRKKEIIKSGGNRISVKEIEETLLSNSKIHEVAVFGVPDDIFGEAVKAVIVLREGETADEKEIQKYIRSLLQEYKVPRFIEFRDSLPKTQAGKLDKKALQ